MTRHMKRWEIDNSEDEGQGNSYEEYSTKAATNYSASGHLLITKALSICAVNSESPRVKN